MKYDDAKWHFESTPEGDKDTRWNQAAAHIGVYLRCCFAQGWIGEQHAEDDAARLAAREVIAGIRTGTDFLITYSDCRLLDDDLSEEGNAFTAYYYDKEYTADIEPFIKGELLNVSEAQYDYLKIKAVFDKRYAEWVAQGRPAKAKAWWRFW